MLTNNSKWNLLVIFIFFELICPRIPYLNVSILVDEGLYSPLERLIRIQFATDGFARKRISLAVSLYMLFDNGPFVGLPSICDDWILHQIESYFTAEIVRNLQLYILVCGLEELNKQQTTSLSFV
jgi:hypothetical protein